MHLIAETCYLCFFTQLTLSRNVKEKNNQLTLKTVQNLHKYFHIQAICKLHGHRECEKLRSPHVMSCGKKTEHHFNLKIIIVAGFW